MKCFSLSLTDLVDKWFEVGIAQKEPARLGNVTILKTHFFYPIGASFEAFKTWLWLGEENKSGIFMKWWKLQNTAWTSNSPPMSQDRLGLHRELVSLLITCISLAPAKGARLVAPGTEFSIYPQSREAGGQTIIEIPTPATIPHVQGPGDRRVTWSQGCTGFLTSLPWLPTRLPVPCTMFQEDGLLNCRAYEREIMENHPTSILRDFEKEEPGIIFFALYSSRLKINEY